MNMFTLPETNIAPENGTVFQPFQVRLLLVSGSVYHPVMKRPMVRPYK